MTVEQRIERLEWTNRYLAGALIIVCLGLVSVFLMGQARPPQRITASEFVLANASGAEVARLGTYGDDGLPELSLRPPVSNGSGLSVRYTKTTRYMVPDDPTSAQTESEPSISMYGFRPQPNASVRMDMGIDLVHRMPQIMMLDDNGKVVWYAP